MIGRNTLINLPLENCGLGELKSELVFFFLLISIPKQIIWIFYQVQELHGSIVQMSVCDVTNASKAHWKCECKEKYLYHPPEKKNLLKSFLICAEVEMLNKNEYDGVWGKNPFYFCGRTKYFIAKRIVSVCTCIEYARGKKREIKRGRIRNKTTTIMQEKGKSMEKGKQSTNKQKNLFGTINIYLYRFIILQLWNFYLFWNFLWFFEQYFDGFCLHWI